MKKITIEIPDELYVEFEKLGKEKGVPVEEIASVVLPGAIRAIWAMRIEKKDAGEIK